MSLQSVLPKVTQTLATSKWSTPTAAPTATTLPAQKSLIPKYPHRHSFIPTTQSHFCDGGAYPEIKIVQYPLSMGRNIHSASNNETLPLSTDKNGKLNYEMVLILNNRSCIAIKEKSYTTK